tara:strand:+ start:178 stop:459 length:282 start_codon:yes stop_codon:yes gene_type:complete
MCQAPDDLEILTSKYRTMSLEELKAHVKNWEETTDCSDQRHSLDIAKKELGLKNKERQAQLELLTQSLTSSSRIRRWISSVAAVLKRLIEFKN